MPDVATRERGFPGPAGGVTPAQYADHETRLDTLETNPIVSGTVTAASLNVSANAQLGDSASDTTTVFRLATGGATPTLTNGAALGSSPGAQTKTGNDTSGTIIQNVGTSPVAGILWTVAFAAARPASTYNVTLSELGTNAADARLYVTNRTVNGFDIGCRVAPTASVQIAVGWLVVQ